MSVTPATDLSQDLSLGDFQGMAAFSVGTHASLLGRSSIPSSSRATSDCPSATNAAYLGGKVDFSVAPPPAASMLGKFGFGHSDSTSLESWLLSRLDSIEVMLNRRCDSLESRMGVLTGAIYGESGGFQQQLEALKMALEAVPAKWEAMLEPLRADIKFDRVRMADLTEGLKLCGKGHAGLQSSMDEMRRLLLHDHALQVNQERSADMTAYLQRLIDRVERTCSDISGQIGEEQLSPPKVERPSRSPSIQNRLTLSVEQHPLPSELLIQPGNASSALRAPGAGASLACGAPRDDGFKAEPRFAPGMGASPLAGSAACDDGFKADPRFAPGMGASSLAGSAARDDGFRAEPRFAPGASASPAGGAARDDGRKGEPRFLSTAKSTSPTPSRGQGSVLAAARGQSSMLAASTLSPIDTPSSQPVGALLGQSTSSIRRVSPNPSLGGSSSHHSRSAARPLQPRFGAQGGYLPSRLGQSNQPRASVATRENLALV